MAGTYPQYPSFEAVNFQTKTPTLSVETASGKSQRVGMGHSFYTFSADYNNMTKRESRIVHGFLAAQYGKLEDFDIVLPEISYSTVQNQYSNIPYTTSSASKGANSVEIENYANNGELLNSGDFFKFNNHSKVYQCVVTWYQNEPLYFAGGLVEDVPSGTGLTIDAVPFRVILSNSVQEWETGIGGITTMSVDFREVW